LLQKSIYDHWAAALRLSGKCGPEQLQRPIVWQGGGGSVVVAGSNARILAETVGPPRLGGRDLAFRRDTIGGERTSRARYHRRF
jgi:hypothetical protein